MLDRPALALLKPLLLWLARPLVRPLLRLGLNADAVTVIGFAAMCLWPQHFGVFAYGFAALCGLTLLTRLSVGWRSLSV